jgi:hypothetical protein
VLKNKPKRKRSTSIDKMKMQVRLFDREACHFIQRIHEILQDFNMDKPLAPIVLDILLTTLKTKLSEINNPNNLL